MFWLCWWLLHVKVPIKYDMIWPSYDHHMTIIIIIIIIIIITMIIIIIIIIIMIIMIIIIMIIIIMIITIIRDIIIRDSSDTITPTNWPKSLLGRQSTTKIGEPSGSCKPSSIFIKMDLEASTPRCWTLNESTEKYVLCGHTWILEAMFNLQLQSLTFFWTSSPKVWC